MVLLGIHSVALAQDEPPPKTIITVNTTTDPSPDIRYRTCSYNSGALYIASTPCSLRRALIEASGRPTTDRPILIQFNIPTSDPGYDSVTGAWTLTIDGALLPLRRDNTLEKIGQVTIDGSTQPGGRTDGPRIIVDTNGWSLEIQSEQNTIRNISWKGGGIITLSGDNNVVENIWMGLTDDGQSLALRTPSDPARLAGGGIHVRGAKNIIRNNVITGSKSRAIIIEGSNNEVRGNWIGTRADGTVPDVIPLLKCLRNPTYEPLNWYGGWGIQVSGSNNRIIGNRIAGLHQTQTANETPPMALEIFGTNHTIQDNVIGVDSAGKEVGVCGQGIKVAGTGTKILSNQVVGSRNGFENTRSAILVNDSSPMFGQITIRQNIIKDGPALAIEMGPAIPTTLKLFKPAKITSLNGLMVTGTSGDNSPCPLCTVDLYLDDTDSTQEALQHLGSVQADANGNFTLMLSEPLPAGHGIRTGSTTLFTGVIGNYGGGTSTALSDVVYLPAATLSHTQLKTQKGVR